MNRLSHQQWDSLHRMILQVHDAKNKQELLQYIVHYFPEAMGINYAVWHELDETDPNQNKDIYLPQEYVEPLISVQDRFAANLANHPVVSGLEIGRDLIFPKDQVYSMSDFGSDFEIKENPIVKEFYSHLECKDSSSAQLTDPKFSNIFVCFNGMKNFTAEQKHMMQILREHITIAFRNLYRINELRVENENSMSMLDFDTLTKREKEVLPLILDGKTNYEIAIILSISKRTIEKHVASIIEKANVENRKVLISTFRFKKTPGNDT